MFIRYIVRKHTEHYLTLQQYIPDLFEIQYGRGGGLRCPTFHEEVELQDLGLKGGRVVPGTIYFWTDQFWSRQILSQQCFIWTDRVLFGPISIWNHFCLERQNFISTKFYLGRVLSQPIFISNDQVLFRSRFI